jgi:hypothetical protein
MNPAKNMASAVGACTSPVIHQICISSRTCCAITVAGVPR